MIDFDNRDFWVVKIADSEEYLSERIKSITETDENCRVAFQSFLENMQTIYPTLNFQDAINMMSENIIRKPVFSGVFEKPATLKQSPTYILEQNVMLSLASYSLEKELSDLDEFYNQMKSLMTDTGTLDEKKRIGLELEEEFFKVAFPNRVKRHSKIMTA